MKKIMLLISLLFLTGCTANYDLTYENDTFSENFSFLTDTSYQKEVDYYKTNNILTRYDVDLGDIPNEDFPKYCDCYEKSILDKNGEIGVGFSYTFKDKKLLSSSSAIRILFKNVYISDDSIRATNINNIFKDYEALDNIVITFKSDKKVYYNNADKEEKGIYYWYINKYNYTNRNINIVFSGENSYNNYKIDNNKSNKIINIVLSCIIIFILIMFIVIYEKVRKSNK